jgi:hypothetical protein
MFMARVISCCKLYFHSQSLLAKQPAALRHENATLLVLATLGNAIQIEMIIFVLYHPGWPRQVKLAFSWS